MGIIFYYSKCRSTMKSLCVLVIMCISCVKLSSSDLVPQVAIARCRVNCLQVTLKRNRINDEICQDKYSCDMCWKLCPPLFQHYNVFATFCDDPNQCHKGCKTACKFRNTMAKVPENKGINWSFRHKPFSQVYDSTQILQIIWEHPEPEIPQSAKIPFVYILFMKDSKSPNSQWKEIKQTASTALTLSLNDLPIFPKFWLLAVNKNGTRVSALIDMDFHPITQVFPVKDASDQHRGFSSNSELNTTVRIEKNPVDGKISALVEWKHPVHVVGTQITYEINYFLEECGIYRDSPACGVPAEHYGNTVTVPANQKPSYRITDVLYNALYNVLVDYGDIQDKINFKTPSCANVDENEFLVCPDVIATTKDPNKPEPTTQADPADAHSVYPDPKESLRWNINTGEPFYIKTANRVSVTFNWSMIPLNQSAIEFYKLTYNQEDMTEGSDAQQITTNKTKVTLQLKPYRTYIVSVDAYFRTSIGYQISSSESVRFNTSGISFMPLMGESRSHIYHKGKNWKNLNDIIVAATCIATVIIVGLIIVFIYKKRQSFKDIIITKTAVAKSNSYKSNVGCKVDYSNQLLMMSDEWELDPCLLKFSSPIGQGAFGKVVTGYYKESRVAIKLVRDSAPLSYKEDLLAEINLMKRIGSHPNIVSMTGACTLSEPIALIMEYVPFGNLQNFLKKCRLEGDFQKRVGRPSEVMYSIMDEHGGLDSGVITPADMLSFARQIAMAMEYLSAKKYVHRDLAARNVLLDQGKIVKVCDFGLSRDIFNDNQYHKVTSGKLPLKWMAIESLRDRVFTTQSDVWSFGILFWEIVTMGGSPYTNIALADLYYVLANGYRMEKPSNCSNELYAIMRQCWMENPSDRPNFTDVRVQLEQLLSRDRNYLELDNIDVPLSTSESSSLPKSENENMTFLIDRPTSQQPCKSVTIAVPPTTNTNVCIEQPTAWLIRGRDDETTS